MQKSLDNFVPKNLWTKYWVVMVRPSDAFERVIKRDLVGSGIDINKVSWTDVVESFVEVVYVIALNEAKAKQMAFDALKEQGFPDSSYGPKSTNKYKIVAREAKEKEKLFFIDPVKIMNHNSLLFRDQIGWMW